MVEGRPLVSVEPIRLLDKPVARRSLDKRNLQLSADLAQPCNLLVLEEVILEDDFQYCAASVCSGPCIARSDFCLRDGVVDPLDLGLYIAPVTAKHFADIDDHVNLLSSSQDSFCGLGDLDGSRRVARREADDGADLDVRAGQSLQRLWDAVWLDARSGDVVVAGDLKTRQDFIVCHGGMQQGVIDLLGDVREGHLDGLWL